jgi:hypothetical protein
MEIEVGRIIRSSTERFAVGCQVLRPQVPVFGSLVKVRTWGDDDIYGLIHDVRIEDDLLVRQIAVASEELGPEYVEHMRRNRQIPIEVGVLVVGYRRGDELFHHLPPQPPLSLDVIHTCTSDELVAFTYRFDYFRLVLGCRDLPSEELLAANLRYAAQARNDFGRGFLVEAGRELARLLGLDLPRLDGILRRIQP